MKTPDIIQQLLIFLASVLSTAYSLLTIGTKAEVKRVMIISKLLGSVIVAFFVMPAVKEYFDISIRITLLFTVIVAYGIEGLIKASVNKLTKTINNNGEDNISG